MYFGSTLIWFFAVEQYGPSLKTTEDLLASGMELGIDKRTHDYFKHDFSSPKNVTNDKESVFDKLTYCNSTKACLSKIVRNR